MQRARVFIKTYGCTMNQSDSEVMAGIILASGMKLAPDENAADVLILNTCTVKGATEQKIIHKVKELLSAKKKIVLAGCLPEADLALIRKYAPRVPIVGTRSLTHIADAVRAALEGKTVEFFNKREEKLELPRLRGSVIAKIPIAEGCVSACSFCATKLARGNLRSYPEEAIISEVGMCVKKGCKEIQLTAQDTGAYGLDSGTNIARLLHKISELPGDFRVRVGMMNPEHALKMLPGLIDSFRSPKIYKFTHIPVQSGNDKVLKDMRRRYAVKDFLALIRALRKKFPELTLATDIIVGYPTETEEAFEDTLRLLRKLRFDIVNVSKFTPRPHTPAAKLRPLPSGEVKCRSEIASALCRRITLEKNKKLVGKTFRVLITERQAKGFSGRTDSYRQVAMKKGVPGAFVEARIAGATNSYLFGASPERRQKQLQQCPRKGRR